MCPVAWDHDGHPRSLGHHCITLVAPWLQEANINCVHLRLWWGYGNTLLSVLQHSPQTHVPGLTTCTMTSSHWAVDPLTGFHNPAIRNYGSNGSGAEEVFSQRGFEIICRKVKLNMLWHFWNLTQSSMSFGPLKLSLPRLFDYLSSRYRESSSKTCWQTQYEKGKKMSCSKSGFRNATQVLQMVLKQWRALFSSIHSPISLDVCS